MYESVDPFDVADDAISVTPVTVDVTIHGQTHRLTVREARRLVNGLTVVLRGM